MICPEAYVVSGSHCSLGVLNVMVEVSCGGEFGPERGEIDSAPTSIVRVDF